MKHKLLPFKSRYEIENFVVGRNTPPSRKYKILTEQLSAYSDAKEAGVEITESELAYYVIYQTLLDELLAEHSEEDLIANFEKEEEAYWVEHYAELAAVDLISSGQITPANLYKINKFDKATFTKCVQRVTAIAQSLDERTQEAEKLYNDSKLPKGM